MCSKEGSTRQAREAVETNSRDNLRQGKEKRKKKKELASNYAKSLSHSGSLRQDPGASAEAVCELQARSRMVNRLIPRHISYSYQEKLVGLDGGGSVKVSTEVEAVRL